MLVFCTFAFTMRQPVFLLITILAGLTGCKSLSPVTAAKPDAPMPARIAFATFSAVKVSDQSSLISLIDFQFVTGQIKDNATPFLLHPVEVTLEDSANKPVNRFSIENPLIENLEFPDDRGQLKRMARTRDSARFYLRFNYPSSVRFIKFQSDSSSHPPIRSVIKLLP